MDERQMLEETFRLSKDNNRMLHKMRRHAFWGGIFKFVLWSAILLAPVWFYMTYLNATVERMLRTIDQIQGTSSKAQAQMGSFEAMWKEFESKFSGFRPSSTTPPQR